MEKDCLRWEFSLDEEEPIKNMHPTRLLRNLIVRMINLIVRTIRWSKRGDVMAMKVRRIVTGYNAAGKAVIKTDEQIAAVPRIGAGISGAEIWSTDQMRSTTRQPLKPPNEQVSSSTQITQILWATVAARRSGSTNSAPAA